MLSLNLPSVPVRPEVKPGNGQPETNEPEGSAGPGFLEPLACVGGGFLGVLLSCLGSSGLGVAEEGRVEVGSETSQGARMAPAGGKDQLSGAPGLSRNEGLASSAVWTRERPAAEPSTDQPPPAQRGLSEDSGPGGRPEASPEPFRARMLAEHARPAGTRVHGQTQAGLLGSSAQAREPQEAPGGLTKGLPADRVSASGTEERPWSLPEVRLAGQDCGSKRSDTVPSRFGDLLRTAGTQPEQAGLVDAGRIGSRTAHEAVSLESTPPPSPPPNPAHPGAMPETHSGSGPSLEWDRNVVHLRIQDAALGPIRWHLHLDEGRITAQAVVGTSRVQELLQAHQGMLETRLNTLGLHVEQLHVLVDPGSCGNGYPFPRKEPGTYKGLDREEPVRMSMPDHPQRRMIHLHRQGLDVYI